jgi:oligogalacturonide lyase
MGKGTLFPLEARIYHDKYTGIFIRQVTNYPCIHHHPFFTIPAYDDAMQHLYFVSHRTGNPQIFAEIRETGQLLQLTDKEYINEWSFHPSHDGKYVYFTAGTSALRIDTETLKEELLVDFREASLKENGMVAAGMGTTALSSNDRWWAVHYNIKNQTCLAIIDTVRGKWNIILQRDTIAHMQFYPSDHNLLYYAGPLNDRVWIINRDGSNNRRVYKRNKEKKEWITHESWIPGTKELAFVDWPNGIRCIQVDTGVERCVTSFNAWHAVCSRDGSMMVADTNFPDIGIQIFNPKDGIGEPNTLCYSWSSNIGQHWEQPFPYENRPIKVYAPAAKKCPTRS